VDVPFVNNDVWDVAAGNGSVGGNGGAAGAGGRGGNTGTGILQAAGGNGGSGGNGGNAGSGGTAGASTVVKATGSRIVITNNTLVDASAPLAGGAAGTAGPAGTAGAAGTGSPAGTPGSSGAGGAAGTAGTRGSAWGVLVGAGSTSSLHNNIIAGATIPVPTNSIGVERNSSASLTQDYNLVWSWHTRYINGTPVHDFNQNPLFQSATNHRLQNSSPAIDKGLDSAPSRPAVDLDGVARPLDGDRNSVAQTDLGAFERGLIFIRKEASSAWVYTNDIFIYTIIVDGSNMAPGATNSVMVSDSAPTGTTYDNHLTYTAGSASETANGFEWNGEISSGDVVTIRFQVQATASAGTVITNAANYQDGEIEGLTNQVSSTITDVPVYDFNLDPASDARQGVNGETVVYTFSLHNVGNVADSYTLALSGVAAGWTTQLSDNSVSLQPGQTEQINVSVTIPAGAAIGNFDEATLTATSQGPGSQARSASFTTTAEAFYAMHMDPATASLGGALNAQVIYTLTIYNTGNAVDTYTISAPSTGWAVTLSSSQVGPVQPGQHASFTVRVTIPSNAQVGASNVLTVTAQGNGVTDQSVLTTTAVEWLLFLPLTIKP
jgi:hypothetical protein